MIITKGSISSGELKGVTANRNITAFSLAIKIPFLLFHYVTKTNFLKIILSFLLFDFFVSINDSIKSIFYWYWWLF